MGLTQEPPDVEMEPDAQPTGRGEEQKGRRRVGLSQQQNDCGSPANRLGQQCQQCRQWCAARRNDRVFSDQIMEGAETRGMAHGAGEQRGSDVRKCEGRHEAEHDQRPRGAHFT
jgi:hypothetical protein